MDSGVISWWLWGATQQGGARAKGCCTSSIQRYRRATKDPNGLRSRQTRSWQPAKEAILCGSSRENQEVPCDPRTIRDSRLCWSYQHGHELYFLPIRAPPRRRAAEFSAGRAMHNEQCISLSARIWRDKNDTTRQEPLETNRGSHCSI